MEEYINEMTIVKTEEGDWEAVYAGGRLVIQGHRVDAYELLQALGFDVSEIVAGSFDGDGFPSNLSSLQE